MKFKTAQAQSAPPQGLFPDSKTGIQTSNSSNSPKTGNPDIDKVLEQMSKDEQEQYYTLANDYEIIKTRFAAYGNVIKTVTDNQIQTEITSSCAQANVGEATVVNPTEALKYFQGYMNVAKSYLNKLTEIKNFWTSMFSKLQDKQIPDVQRTIQKQINIFESESFTLNTEITVGIRNKYSLLQLTPIKMEFFDTLQSMCVLKTESDGTKELMGFRMNEEIVQLRGYYDLLISITYKYINALSKANPTVYQQRAKYLTNVIKEFQNERFKLSTEIMQRFQIKK